MRPAIAALLALCCSTPLASDLGTISFPTSATNPAAQRHFITGVLWLHSFGYEDALEEFRAARRLEPGFAMAAWGEAMCHNQPVWHTQDADAGRRALARLGATTAERAAKARSDREKSYLAAVDLLFNAAGDKGARDRAYADAMGRLTAASPSDDEAAVFHAVALLGLAPLGETGSESTLKAGAIAQRVLDRNPHHPGAAHVVIHAYDDREHAARALPAAQTYARIAAASSHALHMPAHIFHQLGMWDHSAASNEASYRASAERVRRKRLSVLHRDYHPLAWLAYEYLQLGRYTAARAAWKPFEEAIAVATAAEKSRAGTSAAARAQQHDEGAHALDAMGLRNDLATLRAHHVIETGQWEMMRGASHFDNVDELFALGLSSAKLGDLPRARKALELLQKFTATDRDEGRRPIALAMSSQLEGLLHVAQGRTDAGIAALRQAAAIEDRMRRPVARPKPVKPSHELLAEALLDAGRAAEAVPMFERAVFRVSNRALSVLGLARAHAKLGNAAQSKKYYQQLLKMWHAADKGLPAIAEATKGGR
jgi:tetratricopeptide (TPR) repeat protein